MESARRVGCFGGRYGIWCFLESLSHQASPQCNDDVFKQQTLGAARSQQLAVRLTRSRKTLETPRCGEVDASSEGAEGAGSFDSHSRGYSRFFWTVTN